MYEQFYEEIKTFNSILLQMSIVFVWSKAVVDKLSALCNLKEPHQKKFCSVGDKSAGGNTDGPASPQGPTSRLCTRETPETHYEALGLWIKFISTKI